MKQQNIGVDIKAPKEKCEDKKCPFHGNLPVRGNLRTGTVVSDKMHNTVVVEWKWRLYVPKYERYESKKTKIKVHNPECVDAKLGDKVKIIKCRPLSKTKNYVVVEKVGQDVDYLREEVYAEKELGKRKVEEKEKLKEPNPAKKEEKEEETKEE